MMFFPPNNARAGIGRPRRREARHPEEQHVPRGTKPRRNPRSVWQREISAACATHAEVQARVCHSSGRCLRGLGCAHDTQRTHVEGRRRRGRGVPRPPHHGQGLLGQAHRGLCWRRCSQATVVNRHRLRVRNISSALCLGFFSLFPLLFLFLFLLLSSSLSFVLARHILLVLFLLFFLPCFFSDDCSVVACRQGRQHKCFSHCLHGDTSPSIPPQSEMAEDLLGAAENDDDGGLSDSVAASDHDEDDADENGAAAAGDGGSDPEQGEGGAAASGTARGEIDGEEADEVRTHLRFHSSVNSCMSACKYELTWRFTAGGAWRRRKRKASCCAGPSSSRCQESPPFLKSRSDPHSLQSPCAVAYHWTCVARGFVSFLCVHVCNHLLCAPRVYAHANHTVL